MHLKSPIFVNLPCVAYLALVAHISYGGDVEQIFPTVSQHRIIPPLPTLAQNIL